MFNIVLVEPEIPQNTGNIGRFCLAAGATLHLVHPLGFQLDDAALKRAGMDYWKQLTVVEHPSFGKFRLRTGEGRCIYCSTRAKRPYWDIQYRDGDYLIFGRETKGLPEELLEKNPDNTVTIPMPNSAARSLNLATAAAIVLYEALRQQHAAKASTRK